MLSKSTRGSRKAALPTPDVSRRFGALFGLAILVVFLVRPSVPSGNSFQRLPGHTPLALRQATRVEDTNVAAPDSRDAVVGDLTITIVLRRSDEAGFQRYLSRVEDANSPWYQHFDSQDVLTRLYGPSQKSY